MKFADLTPEQEFEFIALAAEIEAKFGYKTPATARANELESQGWKVWLLTLLPGSFADDFSADHVKFWDLFWSILLRIRNGEPIAQNEFVLLLLLGRGLGKSATAEAAAVMRGCLLGGYCLYVCESGGQAEEHVGNVRALIDADDSLVTHYYPAMRIDDNAVFRGVKTRNRTDLFITAGGWVCRAKGLDASLRGIRTGDLRPDNIIIDDIDSVNDSIAVSVKKLKQLTASVLPTQARHSATVIVAQNLITETGVINSIYTGTTDALAERTTIGVTNTFEQFRLGEEYVTTINEADGRIRHKILPSAIPTWAGVNIRQAQKFLNDSGLETFLAEYQNSFLHQKNEKVFEFDTERHLITWDQFEAKFKTRHIPQHWLAKASADIGYSKESLSAWLFVARAAQNAPADCAGRYFGYRSLTFERESIDDQAVTIWRELFPKPAAGKRHFEASQKFVNYPELFRLLDASPDCSPFLKNFQFNETMREIQFKPVETLQKFDALSDDDKAMLHVNMAYRTYQSQIRSWVISHEKTGEQKTLAQKYGIPAQKVKRFEADAGVAEANHLLRGDYTQPHPFHQDELIPETGLWRLGSPYILFVVDRVAAPRDDRDFKTFREQVGGQRWSAEKLGDLGLSRSIPMKYRSDFCDAFRMIAVDFALPQATPFTMAEQVEARMPAEYRAMEPSALGGYTIEEEMSLRAARAWAEERTKYELGLGDDADDDDDDEW